MSWMLHIRPFYYDPAYVAPLNIAVKDTDVMEVEIVNHDFSNPQDKKWLVQWLTDPPSETWEQCENLKNVEAFQHYQQLSSKTHSSIFRFFGS